MAEQDPAVFEPVFHREGQPQLEGVHSAGETRADPVQSEAALNEREFPISERTTLQDLSRDHVFFTHGLLFTHGFFTHDPIEDFVVEQKGKCNPFQVQLPRPIFSGFDFRVATGLQLPDGWNYNLVVVPVTEWEPLYRWLCEVAGVDRKKRRLVRLRPSLVPVMDTLAMAREITPGNRVPTVPCVAFELAASDQHVYFAPGLRKQPWDPVPVKIKAPEPEFVRFAAGFFAGNAAPLSGTLEPTPQEAETALRQGGGLSEADRQQLDNPRKLGVTDRELLTAEGVSDDLLRRVGFKL